MAIHPKTRAIGLSLSLGILLALFGQPLYAQHSMSASLVASGFDDPVYVTAAPGDDTRLFVLEQNTGQIRIVNARGDINSTPFHTIFDLSTGGERGLLGMAFHPEYQDNGRYYVNFTNPNGDTVIREYTRSTADRTEPNSRRDLLTIEQPRGNHNAGWIGFGPDGMLHIATGDGGGANDPDNNSQDITNNLLGKLLRIDVDGDDFPNDPIRNYAIPADNPFVSTDGDDEILHYGLRNPWRTSFDRETGDLYIGDVGQNELEEINVAPVATSGLNFGWRLREGTIQTPDRFVGGPAPAGAVEPIYEYEHGGGGNEGFSVTGGYAYRGPIEALDGHYFFGDFVNQRVWSTRWDGSETSQHDGGNTISFTDWTEIIETDSGRIDSVASFGEDNLGNLYVVDYGGQIFRIDDATFRDCEFENSVEGCSLNDINLLVNGIGGDDPQFDLNADGKIDFADIQQWLLQASDRDNPAKANPNHTYILGDVNIDGQINSDDLGLLLNNFGSSEAPDWSAGNLNGDGTVDSADLGILLNNFGHQSFQSSSAAVPEPDAGQMIWMAVLATLYAFSRRRVA